MRISSREIDSKEVKGEGERRVASFSTILATTRRHGWVRGKCSHRLAGSKGEDASFVARNLTSVSLTGLNR